MRNRMGDTGLPWGMPAEMLLKGSVWPSKESLSCLWVRKDWIQEMRLQGSLSCWRVARRLF